MPTEKNLSAIEKLNENIAKTSEKLEQLKRRKKAQEQREQKKARAEDTRRKIIIGGIVLKYFPELAEFHPQRNNADNNLEFAPLANFLAVLAGDKDLISRIKTQANAQQ